MALSLNQLRRVVRADWFTPGSNGRWGAGPLCAVGGSGIAKSAVLEDEAELCGFGDNCLTLTLSDREPSELSGLGFPDKDHKYVTRLVEEWIWDIVNGWERGVLFLDELSTLPTPVQAVVLRLLRDGVIGGKQLPPGVRQCAAMNPPELAAGGHRIPAPTANRVGWLPWNGPTVDEYCDWIASADLPNEDRDILDPVREEKRVLAGWHEAFADAKAAQIGALQRFGPKQMVDQPAAHDPKGSAAWPSCRTNEYAMRAMAGSVLHGLDEMLEDVWVAAYIGEGPASKLLTYKRERDIPLPKDVLDGKEEWAHDPRRPDKTHAVLGGCMALLGKGAPKREARASAMWDLLDVVSRRSKDLIAGHVRNLLRDPVLVKSNPSTARKVAGSVAPMLEAVGVNLAAKGVG